jgi:urease accessory protein
VTVSLLLFRVQIGRGALLALCVGFTLVHGMAHGQEAPAGSVFTYFTGFTFAGALLFAGGVWLAQSVKRQFMARVPMGAIPGGVRKNHSRGQGSFRSASSR